MKNPNKIQKKLSNAGKFILSFTDKKSIRGSFYRAGLNDIPYASLLVSSLLVFFMVLGGLTFFYIYSGFNGSGVLFGLLYFLIIFPISLSIVFLVLFFLSRIFLSMVIFNRVQKIEKNLPTFLREFSTNLKAGREFVDALEDAISPDLGPLYKDLKAVLVEIRGGKSSRDALTKYSMKYDSYSIREIFEIIVSIHEGGGRLSDICQKSAKNLDRIEYMKKSAIASVANYIVFTAVVALVISPVLFALSYNLLSLIQDLFLRLATTGQNQMFSGSFTIDVDFEQFKTFSYAGISLIAGCAAIIISMIKRGSIREAPLRIVIFVLVAVIIYIIASIGMEQAFNILFEI